MSCSPHNSEGWFLVFPPFTPEMIMYLKIFWFLYVFKVWCLTDLAAGWAPTGERAGDRAAMTTAATMENWQSAELLCQAQLASLYLPCFSMLSDTRTLLNDERWFVPCLFLPRLAWLILPHHTCFYKLILQTNIVFSIMPCSLLKVKGDS